MTRPELAGDAGSIAPLAIGLASILLATTLTIANAGSLLLFQQREQQQAEAMALAVDDALSPEQLAASITDSAAISTQASRFSVEAGIGDFEISTVDGLTVTAKVCGLFNPPIEVPLLGPVASPRVCAIARARRL